jgi:protein involved in polysaccharide export with SLBB domain
MRAASLLYVSAALATLACGRLLAQAEGDPARAQATRASLEELLRAREQAANSSAYSDRLRSRARREAALIRQRLDEGDFQVGDRIVLQVEGEQRLSDTFAVETGRIIELPQLGRIPLAGVLRSELQSYLTRQIGQFVRSPQLTTRTLLRVSILGAVNRPGFYSIPTGILMEDLLMTAGGPSREAKLLSIYIERDEQKIWEGEALQQAITEGRTVDYLSLRAGDRIFVPVQSRGSDWSSKVRILQMLVAIPSTIFTISRLF